MTTSNSPAHRKFLFGRSRAADTIRLFTDRDVELVGARIIGPHDELYAFKTPGQDKLYLVVRDYTDYDLDYEAGVIESATGIVVGEFLKVKNSHNYEVEKSGLSCLAFLAK